LEIFFRHPHFKEVLAICRQLDKAGFCTYLAGGCVRDALLGHTAYDFDVATDAKPDQLEGLFPQALKVGKQFGVIILPFKGFQVEVATFRRDGKYVDGRHPDQVEFSSPEEDALRRDFTVNALFYDLKKQQVIDYVGGRADLKKGLLRTVGDPYQRFSEDKLRVLRAVRIAAQLNFEIEGASRRAVEDFALKVKVVSQERITTELKKIMRLKNRVQALYNLHVCGLAQVVLPELSYFEINQEFRWRKSKHLAQVLASEKRLGLLWASLLWQEVEGLRGDSLVTPENNWPCLVKDLVELILRQLKCSLKEIGETTFILTHFDKFFKGSMNGLENKDSKSLLGEKLSTEEVKSLLLLDQPYGLSALDFAMAVAAVEGLSQERLLLLQQQYLSRVDSQSGYLPKPCIDGEDLLSLGFEPGPKMGLILNRVYHDQIGGIVTNRKEALALVKALKKNLSKKSTS